MNQNNSLVLATDLDGTFLGGSPQQRQNFYEYLEEKRARLTLIFVTGRNLQSILSLYEDPEINVPRPDYIIGDVGTTVYYGTTLEPVAEVQNWIAEIWNNANEPVKTLLANDPGLTLQPINTLYRVSYFYNPKELQSKSVEKIKQAGFNCVMSADKYFDVLPQGVAKGSTLLKLLEHLQLNLDDVITAGDTLNDLALFETGLKSIAVGNSEAKLVEKIKTMPHVYHSSAPGTAGIVDGIQYYGKTL